MDFRLLTKSGLLVPPGCGSELVPLITQFGEELPLMLITILSLVDIEAQDPIKLYVKLTAVYILKVLKFKLDEGFATEFDLFLAI